MDLGGKIRRAILAFTGVGQEGARLVGTSTKTHLGNATTVEAALAAIDGLFAASTSGKLLDDPLAFLLRGSCDEGGAGGGVTSVRAGTGIDVATAFGVATVSENNPLLVATDGPTVTFDLAATKSYRVTIAGDRTFAVTNVDPKRPRFEVIVTQDETGGRDITWWDGISWVNGGTPPTPTATGGKSDHFGFLLVGTDAYFGYPIAQNI